MAPRQPREALGGDVIELRAILCPEHGAVIGQRLGPHLVRCVGVRWERQELRRFVEACGALVATCAGCGGMTLATSARAPAMACAACAFTRPLRPEEEVLDATTAPLVLRRGQEERRPAPAPKQVPMAFIPPPMPTWRPGAALPAPPKPRGYQPPKGT